MKVAGDRLNYRRASVEPGSRSIGRCIIVIDGWRCVSRPVAATLYSGQMIGVYLPNAIDSGEADSAPANVATLFSTGFSRAHHSLALHTSCSDNVFVTSR